MEAGVARNGYGSVGGGVCGECRDKLICGFVPHKRDIGVRSAFANKTNVQARSTRLVGCQQQYGIFDHHAHSVNGGGSSVDCQVA